MGSKKSRDISKKTAPRLAGALRFRIDMSGGLRATVSASSGEFNLTPEIIQILCLLQQGTAIADLASRLRASFRKLTAELPPQEDIETLIEDMIAAQCLVENNQGSSTRGVEDGFADPWIQWAMLADRPRCEAYRLAIKSRIDSSSQVLDVGSGTGLLSLYALDAGAQRVDAIEETSVSTILSKVRQQLPDSQRKKFNLHNSNSADARFPSKITHVVSELFGNDPLQEGVIATLRDVFARIETRAPKGIPDSFSVFFQIFDCVDGPLKNRIGRFAEGKTENKTNGSEFINKIRKQMDFSSVSFSHPVRIGDMRANAPLKKAFEVPLAPPPPLNARLPKAESQINITSDLRAPILLLGFRAQLSPQHSISNLPGEKDTCEHWSPVLVPLKRMVKKDERLKVDISVTPYWERLTATVVDETNDILGSRG
ncbi:class I SAM-dependent methyltransferase [bacterium]|nr:class I SAM-dependent methyltransferase [bacterium]